MLCVEFPRVQYIDLSELIPVLKPSCDYTEHLNESTISVVCHLFIAKVYPEWKKNRFWDPDKVSLSLNRGVPSLEVTNTKII